MKINMSLVRINSTIMLNEGATVQIGRLVGGRVGRYVGSSKSFLFLVFF